MIRAAKINGSMIALASILICAAVVRVCWPGAAEFKYDEAMISRRAIALAQQAIWPASTISSIPGIPQPAIKAFLLAIPYAFTRNPMVAVAFQGLLGTITVGLAYAIGKTYFHPRAGLIAAALLAVAPWALFYDSKLWSQNVPVFTAAMILGLLNLVVRKRQWGLVLACGALGLLIGFYLGNAILGGIIVLTLALFPRAAFARQPEQGSARSIIWLALAAFVLAITLAPYAVELGARPASASAVEAAVSENTPRAFDPLGQLKMSALVATGFDYHALAGDQAQAFDVSLPLPSVTTPVDAIALWLFVVAMLYVPLRALVEALRASGGTIIQDSRVTRVAPYAILAIWLLVPVAAWTAFRQMPYPHRYIMAYPSQAIALGVMLNDLWGWADSRWPRLRAIPATGIVGAVLLLSAWHLVVYFGMMRFVDTTPISGGHGPPVERLWAAAEQARTLSGPQHLPIVIHTGGDDPEHQGGAAEFDAVLGDLPIYLVRVPGMEVFPARDYVWLEDQGNGRYQVDKRTAPVASGAAGLARQDNGIDLLTVEPKSDPAATIAGRSLPFDLTWRVWASPPDRFDYGYTFQLYDSNGQNLGQVDSPFLRSAYWRIGDTIETQLDVPAKLGTRPAGPYHLVVAMYAYIDDNRIAPVNILDIAGNPAGQQITVPLE